MAVFSRNGGLIKINAVSEDATHINEPDCYIKEKLKNGEMAQSRYDSYTQIYNKLKSVKEWEKK